MVALKNWNSGMGGEKGGLDLKPTKLEHIFVAVITFFPLFCANTFDTSLLLIVCALKWYIKSLYRHLFLEDISNHARVTQKRHFLICGKLYSQAPWPQRPKLGVRVAKGLSCDRMDSLFFPGEPPLRYRAEKRRDHGNLPYAHANFRGPPLLNTISQGGGFTGKKKSESIQSQLRPLATRTPSLGRCGQGAWL